MDWADLLEQRSGDGHRVASLVAAADSVVARDRAGQPVGLPHDAGLTSGTGDAIDHLSAIHPDDRSSAARAWGHAVAHPDQIGEATVRVQREGLWIRYHLRHVNLFDVPGLEVMLTLTELDRTTPSEPADERPRRVGVDTAWSLLTVGPVGEVLSAQGALGDLYGRSADELVGSPALDLVHPDDHAHLLEAWVEVVERDVTGRALRQRVLRADGTATWVLSSIGRPDPNGPVVVHDLDITEQLAAEAALSASEARFRRLAGAVPTAVFVCDADGAFTFRNPRFFELPGLGSNTDRLEDLLGTDHGEWDHLLDDTIGEGFELEAVRPGGTVLRVRCGPPHDDGTVVGVVEDATVAHKWRLAAHHDPLTGLLNRPGLLAALRRRVDLLRAAPDREDRATDHGVVAFVDLDGFKQVNDRLGHDEGDAVLRLVAHALADAFRPDDSIARYGGDEFVVVADGVEPGREDALRRRIEEAVANVHHGGFRIGASVGIVRIIPNRTPEGLISDADRSMYLHKHDAVGRADHGDLPS